jgi:hypothetical protein
MVSPHVTEADVWPLAIALVAHLFDRSAGIVLASEATGRTLLAARPISRSSTPRWTSPESMLLT